MDNIKIGEIITIKQQRDAIHVPIVPVVAGEALMPGQPVSIRNGVAYADGDHIGVVDPFLLEPVFEGYNFWVLIKPGTITTLRHDWTHEALDQEDRSDVEASKEWIETYAACFDLTYYDLMSGAENWIHNGGYLCGSDNLEGAYVSDEFWGHFEKVANKKVPEEKKSNFFTCSC